MKHWLYTGKEIALMAVAFATASIDWSEPNVLLAASECVISGMLFAALSFSADQISVCVDELIKIRKKKGAEE